MIRIITCTSKNARNAGPKAKEDIIKILKKEYGGRLAICTIYGDDSSNFFGRILCLFKRLIAIIKETANKDIIIIQYPIAEKLELLSLFPKKRTIIVVHDLTGLRFGNAKKNRREIKKIKGFRAVIVHNPIMKQYLLDNGLKASSLFEIKMFDYLVEGNNRKIREKLLRRGDSVGNVAFAGNLTKEKAPFLYQLKESEMKFNICLYGIGIEEDINKRIRYIGSYDPNILPLKMDCDLGLVWDGEYDDSDELRTYKRYCKYNNPHKLSCYIAAGIPVIVWSKSAAAKFVAENNIGYTINNIYDINRLNYDDYPRKKKNIEELSKKVRQGYYTKNVFKEALMAISKKDTNESGCSKNNS